MRGKKPQAFLTCIGCLLLVLATTTARAQAPTEADDLRVLVEQMQQRIDALEQEVEALRDERTAAPREEAVAAEPAVAAPPAATVPAEGAAEPDDTLRAYWDGSLRFESADEAFKLRIGGRIQADYGWFDEDSRLQLIRDPNTGAIRPVDLEDGAEIRRLWLTLTGSLYDAYDYSFQVALEDGDVDLRDLYLAMRDVPPGGRLRVGHYKEPFSLEAITSSNSITFLERSLAFALVPFRNVGVMAEGTAFDERVSYAAGIFRDSDDGGDANAEGNYGLTGRITALPWYEEDGRRLWHVGASGSYRSVNDDFRFRTRPEIHLTSTRFLDTGFFPVDNLTLTGLESALVLGPVSLQGEYNRADLDSPRFGDLDFDGYYVQGSWVLTGENRRYRTSNGTLGGVRPRNNFGWRGSERGPGAWELAARYSTLDLDDGLIRGGTEDNWTIGLNWYLNPSIRLMFNYVRGEVSNDLYDGDLEGFQGRFQIGF